MKRPLFYGCGTALVTPMREDGSVDYGEFERLVEDQIQRGADALIVCGTTGESPTLNDEEKIELFKVAVSAAQKRVPVIAGTGSNDTAHTVRLSQKAANCGADGLLLVTPYYNKTNENGLAAHYLAITEAVQIPAIVYNVPSRTGVNLTPAVAQKLAADPWICGIKEASGNTAQAVRIAALCGEDLPLYAGNDNDTLALLALGGYGVISVVSNLLPEKVHTLCKVWRSGELARAREIQLELSFWSEALFSDVNPIPIKYAMQRAGWNVGRGRLPLCEATYSAKAKVDEILLRYELI